MVSSLFLQLTIIRIFYARIDLFLCPAVRTGFLHIAEALELHRDAEVPLRAIIVMLKAGDRCNAEAELIVKGM